MKSMIEQRLHAIHSDQLNIGGSLKKRYCRHGSCNFNARSRACVQAKIAPLDTTLWSRFYTLSYMDIHDGRDTNAGRSFSTTVRYHKHQIPGEQPTGSSVSLKAHNPNKSISTAINSSQLEAGTNGTLWKSS